MNFRIKKKTLEKFSIVAASRTLDKEEDKAILLLLSFVFVLCFSVRRMDKKYFFRPYRPVFFFFFFPPWDDLRK